LALTKVLGGRLAAKRAVRPAGVVAALESIDERVELVEPGRQLADGVELVAPGAVTAPSLGDLRFALNQGYSNVSDRGQTGITAAGCTELRNGCPMM
jgi:hypothetical protein